MSADFSPTIIIDTREQDPLPFATYPTERGTLTSGDYSVAGCETLFSIERKTVADLVQSLTSGRERFARLLVIGYPGAIEMGQYRSRVPPKAIQHSLYSLEARYVPVVWARTPAEGAELVERWAFWFARSIVESARKIRGVDREAAVDGQTR